MRGAYYDYVDKLQEPRFIDKIKDSFQSVSMRLGSIICSDHVPIIKRPLTWVPVPVCLLLICLFYLLMMDQPLLDQSYQIARSSNIPVKSIDIHGNERAFAPSNDDQPVYRAFGAGLWQGKQQLMQQESIDIVPAHLYPDSQANTLETWKKMNAFSFYYQTAKWCYLTYSSYESGLTFSNRFWKNQLQIINVLLADYQENAYKNETDKTIISNSLHNVQAILKQSDHFHLTKRQHRHIRDESFRLMNHFNR